MKLRRTMAALAAAAVLLVATTVPRPARAMDSAVEVGLITTGVVSGIMLLAVLGTALTRDDPRFFQQTSPGLTGSPLPRKGKVHFGPACPRGGASSFTICW